MKTLKVGAWWNKYTETQKKQFQKIYSRNRYDVNVIRKFITEAYKTFGSDNIVELRSDLCVVTEKGLHAYLYDSNRFSQVNEVNPE